MHFNLLSQNFILLLGILCTALISYSLAKYTKVDERSRVARLLAVALLLAAIGNMAIVWIVGDSKEVPTHLWLLLFPITIGICLPVILWRKRPSKRLGQYRHWHVKLFSASLAIVVIALLFASAWVNNYYHYFPTLYSIFNTSSVAGMSDGSQTDLHYSRNTNHAAPTLESFLLSRNSGTLAGKIQPVSIPGTVSKFKPRQEWVYVPKVALNTSDDISLPVLIMMPGVPGNPVDWLNGGGLQHTLDDFAKKHQGVTPLVFAVDDTGGFTNDTECTDSSKGNVETYLSVDVPTYIKSHYNVSTNASHWAIGGYSMGGTCSVMLALRHPNVYRYFLDFGGEIGPEVGSKNVTIKNLFHNSAALWLTHQPDYLLKSQHLPQMGGFFAIGKTDDLNSSIGTRQLYNEAKAAKLDTVFETVNGGHTFNAWKQNFADALPWVSNRIGATDCEIGCY